MKNTFASNGNCQSWMGIQNGGRGGRWGKGKRQISRDQHGADQGNQFDLLHTKDDVMDDDFTMTTTKKIYNVETPLAAPTPNADDSIFHTTATVAETPMVRNFTGTLEIGFTVTSRDKGQCQQSAKMIPLPLSEDWQRFPNPSPTGRRPKHRMA
jgi:hypothetical protein